MSLRQKYAEYRDNRVRRDVFLSWAKHAFAEGEVIAVSFPGIEEHYKIIHTGADGNMVRIGREYPHCIMCTAGTVDAVKQSYERNKSESDGNVWRRFFSTPLFEIWENIKKWGDAPPLRHGLTNDERAFLLEVVRKNVTHYLHTGKQLPVMVFGKGSGRLEERLSAGVAIWRRGEVRGCMMVFDKPCLLSVLEASARVLSDARYKPLRAEELPDARFEITLFSDLGMPLLPTDVLRNELYYEKAYRMQQGVKVAWYLPEVFNVVKFSGARNFIEHLARKKGHFSSMGASTCFFEVEDFVESADRAAAVSLRGPIPCQSASRQTQSSHEMMFQRAADHLVEIIDDSGWMSSILDPFDLRIRNTVSLTRSAFAVSALLEYNTATLSDVCRVAGVRAYEALITRLAAADEQLAIGIYMGMAARMLGRKEDTARFQALVLNSKLVDTDVRPIIFLQAARFLVDAGDSRSLSFAQALFAKVLQDFKIKKESAVPVSLAEYADLLVVSRQLGDAYGAVQEEISAWYESYQLADGSFPNTTEGGLPYTRGTGKIFESFAYDPVRHEHAMHRALGWLARMQYTPDSMFFIPLERQSLCLGGFRHDVLNPQAWPDAAGHVLVGAARLIQSGFSLRDRQ